MRSIWLVWLVWLSFFMAQMVSAQELITLAKGADTCDRLNEEAVIVRAIIPYGNRITREQVIFREIEFKAGDTLSATDFCRALRKSRQNLLNRGLFNFVDFDTVDAGRGDNQKDVVVRLTERWYVWPFPIFELAERNFNSWWEIRDFHRINYGFFITINNLRGRMEILRLLARAGYDQHYLINYERPYLNLSQTIGVSLESAFSLSRETYYRIEGHKYVLFRDNESYARHQIQFNVALVYRPRIHQQHFFGLGYQKYRFADTLIKLNSELGFNNNSEYQMLRFYYRLKHDYRDSRPYPLDGHYLEIFAEQRGLGFMANEPSHFNLKLTFDMYRPINKRWHYAFNTTLKTVIGQTEPLHLKQGLGYHNDFVRGYELYVIDGRDYGLLKSNLKYTLVKPTARKLPVAITERFSKIHYALYLNALFDAAFVNEPHPWPDNFLQNRFLFGTGLGLDVVTYYDLVWRLEYSFNHIGQSGFFIHFVAPI